MNVFVRSLFADSTGGIGAEPSLWIEQPLFFDGERGDIEASKHTRLVFGVAAKPKDLCRHLRRIYCCYQNGWSEQLYGALLDLLIALSGKGTGLATRMVYGCRQILEEARFLVLQRCLQQPGMENYAHCRYSVLSSGWIGTTQLVRPSRTAEIEDETDFLALANDFIEYSQLDQAMAILEAGLSVTPDRADIQRTLLELYRSVRDVGRFEMSRKTLLERGAKLVAEWQETEGFLAGKKG